MTRRELREHLFKMLFRYEFHDSEDLKEQEKHFLDENEITEEKEKTELEERFRNAVEKIESIDEQINANTTGWKTSRMGKVDLTIIRLGVFEILYDENVPNGVAINEAVELAKKYGTDDSPSFVNGVLANFAK